MAKFINKKEQVYDLKLTSYGHHLLSIGEFSPSYYAFYDDNVIYDIRYAYEGLEAHATYTQVDVNPPAMDGKTLVLEDASGVTHTATFSNAVGTTTSTTIYFQEWDFDLARIAREVRKSINLANTEGLIGISASDYLGAAQHILLAMDTPGTTGNGKTIGGTLFSAAAGNATVTPFLGGQYPENQNNVDNRIKNETAYLESLVLFEDIDDAVAGNSGESIDPLSAELTWVQRLPRKDIFKMNAAIGDAYLDGKTNAAPAWKIVALQSRISSSARKDVRNEIEVPQLNVVANYRTKIVESEFEFNPSTVREINDQTLTFIDDKRIVLEADDPVFYIEEINTELLMENFEIEVFGYVTSGSNVSGPATGSQQDTLERKYFRKDIPQIVDGFLVSNVKETMAVEEITTGSVEYYFDVLTDQNIEQELACRGAESFNKGSYYIDLDFDCDKQKDEDIFYDIYGSVTEPEICQD